MRRRRIGFAARDRTVWRRVHDVRIGLSALGHRVAPHRESGRSAQRYFGQDQTEDPRGQRQNVLPIFLIGSAKDGCDPVAFVFCHRERFRISSRWPQNTVGCILPLEQFERLEQLERFFVRRYPCPITNSSSTTLTSRKASPG